jgi:hypothetical protein
VGAIAVVDYEGGSLKRRFLSWLLYLANARGSITPRRKEFYAMKDRLLRKYGKRIGEDIQHIAHECYGWGFDGCDGLTCQKCNGSGVHHHSYVTLERWEFAGRIFHSAPKPIGYTLPKNINIEGRIRHEIAWKKSGDAMLWLAFFCDQRFFWHCLTSSRFMGWQWRPMLALQAVVFQMSTHFRRWRPRNCNTCGKRFIRPFESGYWFACRRCSPPLRLRVALTVEDDDLPF